MNSLGRVWDVLCVRAAVMVVRKHWKVGGSGGGQDRRERRGVIAVCGYNCVGIKRKESKLEILHLSNLSRSRVPDKPRLHFSTMAVFA